MKKLIAFMMLFLLAALTIDLLAGSHALDEFIDSHKNSKGSFHMDLGTSFLKEDGEKTDLVKKIENVRIFSMSQENSEDSGNDLNILEKKLKKNGFDVYMNFRDDGSKIDFFALEKNGKVTDWVMLVNGKESLFILEIVGKFELKDVESVGNKMEFGEAKYMKRK